MAISRGKKVQIVDKLKEIIKEAKTLVFVNFRGLSVAKATTLRSELDDQAVGYMVAKKTLVKKVLAASKIKGDLPELTGEIAIAFSQDLIAPARGIYDFSRKNDILEIVGGVFDGRYLDKAAMIEIARIPSREVLYGRFVNIISWPIRGLVVSLDQIAKTKKS